MDKSLGLLFPIHEGDRQHHSRFYWELSRLRVPFAVHFDHCAEDTKAHFSNHPLCVGYSCDDDPKSFFDESYRQRALDVLLREGFRERFMQLDVDETLQRDAPEELRRVAQIDADVVVFPCYDLWGDGRHRRTDGPFSRSHREKVFRLPGNDVRYPHPTTNAPNVIPKDRGLRAVVVEHPLRILHWGIMDMEQAAIHKQRWDTIYTRKVGRNPYGGHDYYLDPATVVRVEEIPEEYLVLEYL